MSFTRTERAAFIEAARGESTTHSGALTGADATNFMRRAGGV